MFHSEFLQDVYFKEINQSESVPQGEMIYL